MRVSLDEQLATLRHGLTDRYRIGAELGRGGMAVVYRGEAVATGAPVAIKVLRPEVAGALGPDRFLREIEITTRLHHPHIVPVVDADQIGETLFLVMPLIEGETLRARLKRLTQLPIDEAVRITLAVCDGLEYAHAHGVVHRDIKPENVLLGERVLITDFGIARLVNAVGADTLSTTGVAIGTPAYMSPEQASASRQIDHRSDLYSLGCVLYEMLAGEPPFTGPTAQAIASRHLAEAPRSLRVVRPAISERLQSVVETALAKVPADRPADARALARAIERAAGPGGGGASRLLSSRGLLVVGLAVLGLLVAVLPRSCDDRPTGAAIPIIAVAPFTAATPDSGRHWAELVRAGFSGWTGLEVVDRFRAEEAATRIGQPLGPAQLKRLADAVGASDVVRGTAASVPGGWRLEASIHDGSTGRLLLEGSVLVPEDEAGADSAVAQLVESLLIERRRALGHAEGGGASRSLPARQAWQAGHTAITEWRLLDADSAFATAFRIDPGHRAAGFWLALVRYWRDLPPPDWAWAVERAVDSTGLGDRDRQLALAITASATGSLEQSCRMIDAMVPDRPRDFVVWYTLARCLFRDDAVVADASSPSGWRFRSSHHHALQALRTALGLLPSIHRGLSRDSYLELRELMATERTHLRSGRTADDQRFLAHAEWMGDTLGYVPYPQDEITSVSRARLTPSDETLRQQRLALLQIAGGWVNAYPNSASAYELLGLALSRLGDRTAADTIAKGRSLAVAKDEALNLAATEVWMRLLGSLPDDDAGVRRALALADSMMTTKVNEAGAAALSLTSVAALTGRAKAVVAYAGVAPGYRGAAVDLVSPEGFRLLALIAARAPADQVLRQEERVEGVIRSSLGEGAASGARIEWLGRPAALAYPRVRLVALRSMAGTGDYLIDLIGDAESGGPAAEATLGRVAAWRQGLNPADLSIDAVLTEARAVERVRSAAEAVRWLDQALGSLAGADATAFVRDIGGAGALADAIGERVRLAVQTGDTAAAGRWTKFALRLWEHADSWGSDRRSEIRRHQRLAMEND